MVIIRYFDTVYQFGESKRPRSFNRWEEGEDGEGRTREERENSPRSFFSDSTVIGNPGSNHAAYGECQHIAISLGLHKEEVSPSRFFSLSFRLVLAAFRFPD